MYDPIKEQLYALDIGSGPEENWYDFGDQFKVVRLDIEPFDGIVKWNCPEPLPIKSDTIDKVYLGQFLIKVPVQDSLKLAKELNRVVKDTGEILIHCYYGILRFPQFFKEMEIYDWYIISLELVNYIEEEGVTTYLVKLQKLRKEKEW